MKLKRKRIPTPAMIVALVALIAAMSGAAVALPGKNSVKSNDIAKEAVKSSHLANDKVKSKDLKDGALKGKDVKGETLDQGHLSDLDHFTDGPVKVTATEGADLAAARAAAPETPLWTNGTLDIYAKCLYQTTGTEVQGEIYARTTVDGALLDGTDNLPDDDADLLTTATLEEDRQIDTEDAGTVNEGDINENEGVLVSADGNSAYKVLTSIAAKFGSLPGGNGAFGAGNVCIFDGEVVG